MRDRAVLARHGMGTKFLGSAGATGKMNGLSQELNSKPTAAGKSCCDEQAVGRQGCFVFPYTKSRAHKPAWLITLVNAMDNLRISLEFKTGEIHPKGMELWCTQRPCAWRHSYKWKKETKTFPTATASCSQDKCLWHMFNWSILLGLWWENILQLHTTLTAVANEASSVTLTLI